VLVLQGDVFWVKLPATKGSEPTRKRPFVIVQRNSINRSKFQTVLVVPLTNQKKHAHLPGNVLLKKGDANLPQASLARGTIFLVIALFTIGATSHSSHLGIALRGMG
jgi:mRNA-degrading endonuclease toxin of MazEF toxin-antitoxin module